MVEWILPSIGCACSMSYRLVQELTLGHKFLSLAIASCQLQLCTCWCSDLIGLRVLSLCPPFPVPWSFTGILTTSRRLADLLSPRYTRRFPLCRCQRPSECYCKFTFARSLIFTFAFLQHPPRPLSVGHRAQHVNKLLVQDPVLRPCSHANQFLMYWYVDNLQGSTSWQTSERKKSDM